MPERSLLDELRVGVLDPTIWSSLTLEPQPVGGISLALPGRPPVWLVLTAGPGAPPSGQAADAWDPLDILQQIAELVRPGWVHLAKPAGRWMVGDNEALRVLSLQRSTRAAAPRPGAWQLWLATTGPAGQPRAWSDLVEMISAFGAVVGAVTVEGTS